MEQNQDQSTNLYKHAAINGAILGGISVALVIIFYAVALSFMASLKFVGLVFVLGIGWAIYAGINYRKEVGGYLAFGKAFIHGAVVFVVSGFIGLLFNLLLYHVIDTELATKMTDTIAQNTEEMMRGFGSPEEAIEETIAKMRVDMPEQFSVGGLAFGYVKAMIWYAVLALITALFVRKNEPVEL